MHPTTDDPDVDPSAASLAPERDHGGSRLVTGSSLDERTRALTRTLDAFRSVITVRIAPRDVTHSQSHTHVPGDSLGDALAVAVESALVAAGAPGGLYDDPGAGALASLPGWLFRARAAGRTGLVVALPEVDTWLESRGANTDRSSALFAALLAATRTCALSVIASVRAVDADGAPALASDHAARFVESVSLGGAAVTTRDANDLVAPLVGRTFTLGALRHALAGFLALAHDAPDDTLIAFDAAPSAVTDESVAVAWSPPEIVATPSAASVSASAGASEAPPVPLGRGWPDAVRAAVQVRDAIRVLRESSAPRGFRQLERAFVTGASYLPTALEALGRGERALDLDPTRLTSHARPALTAFDRTVTEHLASSFPAWSTGSARPALVHDLPPLLARTAAARHAPSTAFLMFTGMRIDAWRHLHAHVCVPLGLETIVHEGVHWAAPPASVARQRELLARGTGTLPAKLPQRDEAPAPRKLTDAARPRRELAGHVEVWRVDLYTALVAHEPHTYGEWFGAAADAMRAPLQRMLGQCSPGTLLLIAGDVGARAPFESSANASASAIEVIAPYAIYAVGARA